MRPLPFPVRSSTRTRATAPVPPDGSSEFLLPRKPPSGPSAEETKQPFSLCHCIINRVDVTFDLVIIGGGIVGLATALEAVRRNAGRRIAVLEKESTIARHQTGHNS